MKMYSIVMKILLALYIFNCNEMDILNTAMEIGRCIRNAVVNAILCWF